MTLLPGLIVPGAAKSGTTTLYQILRQHPQIAIPAKETKFFNRESIPTVPGNKMLRCSEEEYVRLYREAVGEDTRIAAEVSTSYLYYYREAIPKIQDYLGDVNVVIILRDPVARAWSNYQFEVANFVEDLSFEDALAAEERRIQAGVFFMRHYKALGCYYEQVKAWKESFSQVRVYLLEDLQADATGLAREIYDFAGVDPDLVSPDFQQFNASGTPRIRWLHRILFEPTPFKHAIRSALVAMLGEYRLTVFLNRCRNRFLKRETITVDTARWLREYYREDILQLQDLLDRDLSHWLAG